MKKKVGILEEVAYSYRFMQKLNQEAKAFVYAYSFSEQESVKAYLENDNLDVLIVGELYASKELLSYKVETIIVLSEDEFYKCPYEHMVSIYKYQALKKILNELKTFFYQAYGSFEDVSEGIQFIGIYSPVGRCGKTTFALELAKKLAKESRVLYLNLERYGSAIVTAQECPEWNLADVFYFSEQQERQLEMLKNTFVEYEGIRLCFPLDSPLDLQGITMEQWMQLFSLLEQSKIADLVIIDFDECISCYIQLLELCHKIYMPVLEEEYALKKVKTFQMFLEQAMESDVFDKIDRINLPVLSNKELEQLKVYMQKIVEEMDEI